MRKALLIGSSLLALNVGANAQVTQSGGTVTANLGNFQPIASGSRMTPITVTTSDTSGTFSAGGSLLVSNVGANPMYCNVVGVAATTSDTLIAVGQTFQLTPTTGVTTLHCIATGGSTTANGAVGTGLFAGVGGSGSGGGGGGGAITAASGSYAAGALSAGAGVDGWNLTEGTKGDTAYVSGSGSLVAIEKGIFANTTSIATSALQTTGNTSLATLAGAVTSTKFQDNIAQWGGNAITGTVNAVGTVGTGNVPTINAYIVGGAGAGGTSSNFSATFPTAGTAAGAEYLSSPPSLTTGQMVALQVTSAGSLHTTVDNTNANGSATSANSSPVVIASDQVAVATKAASGAIASGAIASGAFASGSISASAAASGAFPAGSITDLAHGQGTMAASVPVAIASNQSAVPTSGAVNVTPTDCSVTLTTGGTAQNAFTAQTTLHGFTIANTDNTIGSGEVIWFSFTGTATANTAGSYPLAPATATTYAGLSSYTTPTGFGTNHALSVVAATTAHKISCTWW